MSAGVARYAGLDYHKKFTVISLGDKDGNLLSTQKVFNDREMMRQFFTSHPGVECAIESCRGYEWLLDFLKEELELVVHLVNVLQANLITQSRCKTDRIDSKSIMQLLAKGYLPTCYQPSPDERRVRERLRWRSHMVRYATRLKVRIHSLLDKENAGLSCDPFSVAGRQLLAQVNLAPSRKELLIEHIRILEFFEAAVREEDAWVNKAVKSDPKAKLLTTLPGVGPLTALLLVSELGDITRFKDASAVCSYFGLVPSIKSSADRYTYGPITKHGSKHVRWMLIQCAWQGIRRCMPLRVHFESVSRRCGRNPAIVSVARKLVKMAYRLLRDNKPFNAQLVGKQESA
jgi:transposase